MKRITNLKDSFPCADFDILGNMYHVWTLQRLCVNGELVEVNVRVPGVIINGRIHCNMLRREYAAQRLLITRRYLRAAVSEAGGLAPKPAPEN